MHWIHLLALLAIVQFLAFGVLVGRARARYKVKAPATHGHDMFERALRVQMNTLEQLVCFLPALYIAASYWNPGWIAALGAPYLLGRLLYRQAYVHDPARRGPGFLLTVIPTVLLIAAAGYGALRGLLAG